MIGNNRHLLANLWRLVAGSHVHLCVLFAQLGNFRVRVFDDVSMTAIGTRAVAVAREGLHPLLNSQETVNPTRFPILIVREKYYRLSY